MSRLPPVGVGATGLDSTSTTVLVAGLGAVALMLYLATRPETDDTAGWYVDVDLRSGRETRFGPFKTKAQAVAKGKSTDYKYFHAWYRRKLLDSPV